MEKEPSSMNWLEQFGTWVKSHRGTAVTTLLSIFLGLIGLYSFIPWSAVINYISSTTPDVLEIILVFLDSQLALRVWAVVLLVVVLTVLFGMSFILFRRFSKRFDALEAQEQYAEALHREPDLPASESESPNLTKDQLAVLMLFKDLGPNQRIVPRDAISRLSLSRTYAEAILDTLENYRYIRSHARVRAWGGDTSYTSLELGRKTIVGGDNAQPVSEDEIAILQQLIVSTHSVAPQWIAGSAEIGISNIAYGLAELERRQFVFPDGSDNDGMDYWSISNEGKLFLGRNELLPS